MSTKSDSPIDRTLKFLLVSGLLILGFPAVLSLSNTEGLSSISSTIVSVLFVLVFGAAAVYLMMEATEQ